MTTIKELTATLEQYGTVEYSKVRKYAALVIHGENRIVINSDDDLGDYRMSNQTLKQALVALVDKMDKQA